MILIADSGSTKTHWKLLKPYNTSESHYTKGLNPYFAGDETFLSVLENDFPLSKTIEISFKTNMINTLSVEYWPHWFLDWNANHFTSPDASYNAFNLINQELEKNKDNIFIKHYYETYSHPK